MLVYAVGNPGPHRSVTRRGIVTRLVDRSAVLKERHIWDLPPSTDSGDCVYIEHDARVYPGDYGAPILNEKCEVIGIQTLLGTMTMNKIRPTDPDLIVQTFGMAVHAKHIADLLNRVSDSGKSFPTGKPIPIKPLPHQMKPQPKPPIKPGE